MPNWVTCFCNERYEVSDEGEVRSVKTGQILKFKLKNGYPYVELWANGTRKSKRINRLILISFVGFSVDPTKKQAAHIDGNRTNNSLKNLAWKNWLGNFEDRIRHGTRGRKLTDDEVLLMRNQYSNGQTQSSIAIRLNVDPSTVSRIVNGHRWKH